MITGLVAKRESAGKARTSAIALLWWSLVLFVM